MIRTIEDKGHGSIRFLAAFQEYRQAACIIFVVRSLT
jgi:hypothetical protein